MNSLETTAYIKALLFIATLDEVLDENELSYFNDIAKSAGLSSNEIENIKKSVLTEEETIEDILKDIVSQETATSLLEQLLKFCYTDGEYSIVEQNGLNDICLLIGVDTNTLKKLEIKIEKENKKKISSLKINNALNKIETKLQSNKEETVKLSRKVASESVELAHSVATGIASIGSKISFKLESAKKVKEENKELREKLKTNTLSEAIKQKVILQLNSKIQNLTMQLKAEKQRNEKNEEMIRELQAQLDDLTATIEVAQSVKTA